MELADLCRLKRLYSATVRFYAEAFDADARLARHQYSAACAAALAGCGQGADVPRPSAAERARLRQKALGWLRAELALRASPAKGGTPPDRAALQDLRNWQTGPDLAGVRDAAGLAALPAAERAAWEKLWADVAAAVARGDAKSACRRAVPPTPSRPSNRGGPRAGMSVGPSEVLSAHGQSLPPVSVLH
jgi:hypothetical protein